MQNNSIAKSLASHFGISTESVDVVPTDEVVAPEVTTMRDEDGASLSPLSPVSNTPIVEAQQTDLAAQMIELEDAVDEDDVVDNDIQSLESIINALTKAQEDDTLTAVSYEMFNIAMDHIYRKYDISATTVMPSMESFESDPSAAATLSMEAVKKTMGVVKENAAEFIKKLWFKLKQFVADLMKGRVMLTQRIRAISTAASKMKGDREIDVSNPRVIKLYSANKLHARGEVPNAVEMAKIYGNTVLHSASVCQTLAGLYNVFSTKEKLAQEELIKSLLAKMFDELVQADKNRQLFQDAKFVRTDNRFKLQTSTAPARDENSTNQQVTPLTPDQIVEICRIALKSQESLSVINRVFLSKNIESTVVNGMGGINEVKGTAYAGYLKQNIKDVLMLNGKIINYYYSVDKAMIDYCAQSLESYSKKPATSEKEEPAKEE